jgi:hypothetical protein
VSLRVEALIIQAFFEPCTDPGIGAKLYNDEYIFCAAEVKATV